jgi:hypothetical protein
MPDPEDPREKFRRLVKSEAETQGQPPADPAAPEGSTRVHVIKQPAPQAEDEPLPKRVDEVDLAATRVTPAAYERTPTEKRQPPRKRDRNSARRGMGWRKTAGCLLRGTIASIFILVAIALVLLTFGIYEYYAIASTLPSEIGRAHV